MRKKSLAFKKKSRKTSNGTPPSTQSKSELAVPRLLKWDISSLDLKIFQIGSIVDEQVNEDELSTSSQEDLIYKNQHEVDEEHEEEGGEEEKEDEEEEEQQDNEEEEEQVVDIEDEAAVEQIAEEEDEENKDDDEEDEGAVDEVAEEEDEQNKAAEERDAAAVEQDKGDSAEEGDSVQKLAEEGEVQNGNDNEMEDMFHTAEAVDEQLKLTNQSATTFVPETQFSNQLRDQTAVEDNVDLGERQTQGKKTIDELKKGLTKVQYELEGVRFLQDNCAKLEEDKVIHEAQIKALEIQNSELVDKCAKLEEDNVIYEAQEGQIRVLEVQNSELEKQTLLWRLELNEECQRRKTVEYEKTKMTREKDAEIALLKQRIKQLIDEKIDIEAEHIVHQVTQQWKQKQQKQSASTMLDPMIDTQLHEITQEVWARIQKQKQKEAASPHRKPSTKVSKQVHLKKRKADSDVNKGAKEAGQTEPSKKRKLSKSGPVFRYLSKESQKKLTTFWKSASTTDSLWAGNHYETSIYADEVSHILEQEAIANSTIDAYAEILLANYPISRCMILSTRWLYLKGKANEQTRWKMYNDDLETVLLSDFVIFPIHENDHWILLVLKVLKGTWCFYDSMRVKRNQSSSKCKAATNIQKRVTAYLKQRWERFPIESTVRIEPGCPQQPPRSDCGIIVYKIMKHFVLNEELQDTISDEECNKIRAEILEAFIADEDRSWQSQEL